MIFLMQSKTFPSYISENSVCAILTQILRELMKVIFFLQKIASEIFHIADFV